MANLLNINQVIEKIGLSRQTIYRKIKEGTFPEQIALSVGRVAWAEHEIDQWIEQKIARKRRRTVIQSEKNDAIYQ